jgi:hypothetical protein
MAGGGRHLPLRSNTKARFPFGTVRGRHRRQRELPGMSRLRRGIGAVSRLPKISWARFLRLLDAAESGGAHPRGPCVANMGFHGSVEQSAGPSSSPSRSGCENSMLAGTLQGTSSIRAPRRVNSINKGISNQNLASQFPAHPNREFLRPCRECKSAMREISALIRELLLSAILAFSRPRTHPIVLRYLSGSQRVRVHEYPDGCLATFHGPHRLADYYPEGKPCDTTKLAA